MSATLDPITDKVTLVRSFELPLADSWDGRTLDVQIVPYNEPATVADPPDFRPYRELFLPGAFAKQLSTPGRDRVLLNFEHEPGIRGVVGQSLTFRDGEDGLQASFGVHENADGDKALLLVRNKILTGLSLEFRALSSTRSEDGIVQRVRAQLDKVSLCRFPAYESAAVLAMRQQMDTLESAQYRPASQNPLCCATCDHFEDGTCTMFNETVDPNWVCNCWDDDAEEGDGGSTDDGSGDGDLIVNVSVDARAQRSSDVDARLAALGFEPLMRIATTSKSWDGSPARFTDEQYRRSTLFCRGTDGPPKQDCSLPVLEPDGTLNVNALGAAAAALVGGRGGLANASSAMKASAARKLIRFYNAAGREVPDNLRKLASS